MIVLWLILAAVVVLAAVVLVRTALFTPGTAPADGDAGRCLCRAAA